jgi:hypothetical protein
VVEAQLEGTWFLGYLIQTVRDFVAQCSRNRRLNLGGILVQIALFG